MHQWHHVFMLNINTNNITNRTQIQPRVFTIKIFSQILNACFPSSVEYVRVVQLNLDNFFF